MHLEVYTPDTPRLVMVALQVDGVPGAWLAGPHLSKAEREQVRPD